MKNIWRISEFLAEKRMQKDIGKEQLEVVTERIFITINMILWILVGLVIALIVCQFCLTGIKSNLPIVFIITGYFAVIMFLTGYVFMCRRSK